MTKIKSIIDYFVVLGVLLILCACKPTPSSYLKSFDRFVSDVEQNASSYSNEDWNKKDARFEEFKGEKYQVVKDQLTREDKKALGKLVSRYYKAKAVATGERFLNEVDGSIDFLIGLGEGIFDINTESINY